MGIFGDLKDWYDEQKRFKEADDFLNELDGKPKQSMFRYIANDFNELVVEPTKDDYKDLKQSIKNDNQQLKNDFKEMCKEVSPPVGEAVEQMDRFTQVIKNHAEASSMYKNIIKQQLKSLNEIKKADHLFVDGKIGINIYTHHGLYLGNGMVIHYDDLVVGIVTYEEFASGRDVYILDSPIIHTKDMVIERAKSRLGERGYNLFNNNCDHFVRWCRSSSEW